MCNFFSFHWSCLRTHTMLQRLPNLASDVHYINGLSFPRTSRVWWTSAHATSVRVSIIASTWRHQHDEISQVFPLRFCTLQVIKNWSRGRPGNETGYKKALAQAPSHKQICTLVRNASNLPIKTNIMLVESFKSSCHGNTFWLTQSTGKKQEKGHKRDFHTSYKICNHHSNTNSQLILYKGHTCWWY